MAGEADSASIDDADAVAEPGKQGQVKGAVTMGLPEAPRTICATIREDIAQWCAPCRRQHGGRRESSPVGRAAASGPRPKNTISRTESARLIIGKMQQKMVSLPESGPYICFITT